MFLLFYISLKKALNLQELFMIFQRRRKYLRNFELIKRNKIYEIEKKRLSEITGNWGDCHQSYGFRWDSTNK